MNANQVYDELDYWRAEQSEADLRVTALTKAFDKARAKRDTIAQVVRSMESLDRQARDS